MQYAIIIKHLLATFFKIKNTSSLVPAATTNTRGLNMVYIEFFVQLLYIQTNWNVDAIHTIIIVKIKS